MKTKSFACYNTNETQRMISSSGGIYFLLANAIIEWECIVYGACYEGIDVRHVRIKSKEDISSSCGSKYIPSELGDTFSQVREDLNNGKKVLFSGTPCQCAGLLTFVGTCENLFCVDFICHGIPSKKVWRSYIDDLEHNKSKVLHVNMRDKCSGWNEYSWSIHYIDGSTMTVPFSKIPFMKGFLADLYLRPSCYKCKFKGIYRITDITMGDYWQVNYIQPKMFDNKGTSLIFVHSQKGMQLLNIVSNMLKVIRRGICAVAFNITMRPR